eukprot:1158393-Lingulodinium_polyedra.AAC.1
MQMVRVRVVAGAPSLTRRGCCESGAGGEPKPEDAARSKAAPAAVDGIQPSSLRAPFHVRVYAILRGVGPRN